MRYCEVIVDLSAEAVDRVVRQQGAKLLHGQTGGAPRVLVAFLFQQVFVMKPTVDHAACAAPCQAEGLTRCGIEVGMSCRIY